MEDTYSVEDFRQRQSQRVCNCCKKFAAFLFSQVGLAAMVVAYSIMGGFLFQALEAPFEKNIQLQVRAYKLKKMDEIWTLSELFHNRSHDANGGNRTLFMKDLNTILVDFQGNITEAVKENGWDGKDETSVQWSYAGALLYAVTVITTIGKYDYDIIRVLDVMGLMFLHDLYPLEAYG